MKRPRLKTLDIIMVFALFILGALTYVLVANANRKISDFTNELFISQNTRTTKVLAQLIERDLAVGNYRYAWVQLSRAMQNSPLLAFTIADATGENLVDDNEFPSLIKSAESTHNWAKWTEIDAEKIKSSSDLMVQVVEHSFMNLDAGNGAVKLKLLFDTSPLKQTATQLQQVFTVMFSVLIAGLFLLFFSLRYAFIRGLRLLSHGVIDLFKDRPREQKHLNIWTDYFPAHASLQQIGNEFRESKIKIERASKDAAILELARQVSHDIRSPLSALNVVMETLSNLPEEKRQIIRNVATRINDIANDLLGKSKDLRERSPGSSRRTSLGATLNSIVIEKKLQYEQRENLEIRQDLQNGASIFVDAETASLARVISNLINNAVEAIGEDGSVLVALRATDAEAEISIVDDGKGIPPDILSKLGERGASFGKGGTGLGLFHARETIEKFGGSIKLQSKINSGTMVRIVLPRAYL